MESQFNGDMSPVVLITTWRKSMDVAPYGTYDIDASITDYILRVQRAGGIALQVPRDVPERAESILARADALVLIGGEDIDPSLYGQENAGSRNTSREADVFELALVEVARRRKLPTFAICRGHQVLNVALGGTLHQDIAQDEVRHSPLDVARPGEQPSAEHRVSIDPEAKILAETLGTSAITNSIHHQAIDRCADGMRVVARADDGVIEAIEPINDWIALSVQWHPEKMDEHQVLFDAFVSRVREQMRVPLDA